jgi:hypothetical protein
MRDEAGRDRCRETEEHRRLQTLLSLYFQGQVWVADWCRETSRNASPPGEIPGFIIHGTELDDMTLDREDLLARMMAGETENPWVRSAQAYDYRRPDGTVATASPGIAIDGVRVERLRIKPHPRFLPYMPFIRILQDACVSFGRNYRSILFQYRGCLCEDPLRLVWLFRTFEPEQCVILQALREWYACACGCVEKWVPTGMQTIDAEPDPPPIKPAEPLSPGFADLSAPFAHDFLDLGVTDPRILCLKLTRHKMAEFLHCSDRTLRRWESIGEAPGGLPWPRPERVGGNVTLYDVARYWKTIRELLPRHRCRETDLQLRDEILADKYALNG